MRKDHEIEYFANFYIALAIFLAPKYGWGGGWGCALLLDVLLKTQPGVIDLVSSINESPYETQFVRIGYKTKAIGQCRSAKGFLTINTSNRRMSVIVVDQNGIL